MYNICYIYLIFWDRLKSGVQIHKHLRCIDRGRILWSVNLKYNSLQKKWNPENCESGASIKNLKVPKEARGADVFFLDYQRGMEYTTCELCILATDQNS